MVTVDEFITQIELNASLIQFSNYAYHGNPTDESKPSIKRKGTDWYSITATQIIVFLLFLFGIVFAILMYCKTCNRASQATYSDDSVYRSDNSESTSSGTVRCYSIYESRDRPPSYSEACGAPPLYGSPYNRASMLEAPPVYPDTPKPSDRVPRQTNSTHLTSSHI